MVKQMMAAVLVSAALVGVSAAQTKKPAAGKPVMNAITVNADTTYTGTMEYAVNREKVTGDLHITAPTEITGKVAGTSKGGVLALEFPYYMVERQCEGTVRMNITLPAKRGVATGTMEAVGCGREEGNKVTGTVELVPSDVPKKK